MHRCTALLAAIIVVMSAALAQAAPARRVALVIGNGAYRHVDALRNPDADARLMAATLRRLGFALVGGGAQLDLDRAGMEAAIHRFRDAIRPGDVAFFYYSGHGVQVDGSNYLVPVSAAPAREADVPVQMVAADLALQDMADAGAGLNIVVLDACRNNPFVAAAAAGSDAARGLRVGDGRVAAAASGPGRAGLAEMHAPRGTIISFATQPGSVAFDGAAGAVDSPYTTALADALRLPGLDIVNAFNRAGIAVGRATAQQQEPWLAISPLEQQVFLAGSSPGASALPAIADAPQTPMGVERAARMSQEPPGPAPQPGAFACPAFGVQAVRNGAQRVTYQGAAPGAADVCLSNVAGTPEARIDGIWPANWPGAADAAAALRRTLSGPAGGQASFDATADVQGLRDTVFSEGWRFTVTYLGPVRVQVGGSGRDALRVRWDERNLSRPYRATADIALDRATGAVLAQAFRVLVGGSGASYDFWSKYQGGLASVPDFRVTALAVGP